MSVVSVANFVLKISIIEIFWGVGAKIVSLREICMNKIAISSKEFFDKVLMVKISLVGNPAQNPRGCVFCGLTLGAINTWFIG